MVRCPIEVLRAEFDRRPHIRDLLVSYSETLVSQVQQTVACNAMHTTEQKMCRWLLMMHDRAEGHVLTYTHEFLSHMLGANRKSVTLAAQSMQAVGFIRYHRGKIEIINRPGFMRPSGQLNHYRRRQSGRCNGAMTPAVQPNFFQRSGQF